MISVTNVTKTTSKIKKIEKRGKENVYDITVRDVHRINANGFYTSNCSHPQIETFINIKRDKQKVTAANISIKLNDEFMNAVETDSEYSLQWPVDVPLEKAEIVKVVRARDIWEQIVDAAWYSAEPGVLFWDRALKMTPSDIYKSFGFGSVSTNPCLTYDTKVAVADGRGNVEIGKLAEEGFDIPVYTRDSNTGKVVIRTMRNPRLTGRKVPVYKVVIEGGHSFKATGNHKMMLVSGEYVEVLKLEKGDQLHISMNFQNFEIEKSSEANSLQPNISDSVLNLDPRIQRTILKARKMNYEVRINDSAVYVKRVCEECKSSFWTKFDSREVAFCGQTCSNFYVNRNTDTAANRTKSINEAYSKKGEEKKTDQLNVFTALRFELSRDPMQKEWVDCCSAANVVSRLGTKYGFEDWKELKTAAALHNHRVESVEYAGEEDVFNGTVDEFHNFYMGGWEDENNQQLHVLTKNCGEIVLSPYDSCRLLVVNFSKFVLDPFLPTARFDFESFDKTVQKAQRLMDDLIDLELEAVDRILLKIQSDPEPEDVKRVEFDLWTKIRNAAEKGRRTGLGPTALADALAALNVRYGSDESIEWTEKLYMALELGAYRSSVNLAKERGSFPVFSADLEKNHPFLDKILSADEVLKNNHELYGRRNIALTTTAPVGSVSILTQTTSGIEPVYLLSYKRMRKINPNEVNVKVDMVDDMGDKWQEYTVFHHGVQRWMDATGNRNIEESPYWKSTSADVDWVAGVKMQAVAQKWICHSISRTSNLPKSASHSIISDIYIEAWKSGCKGFTVYRDKSRVGVLLTGEAATSWFEGIPSIELEESLRIGRKNLDKMPDKYALFLDEISAELSKRLGEFDMRPQFVLDIHAPKRQKELSCDIHRVNVRGESYTVLIGLLDEKPYEVFCGLSEQFELPRKIKNGVIVKNGKKEGIATYNLKIPVADDYMIFNDVVNLFDNPVYGAATRLVSLSLRHGVPVQYVVEQLRKDKHSDLQSFSSGISRILKTYIKDGTKATEEKECPSCGAQALIYQEGCVSCTACGHSKCS